GLDRVEAGDAPQSLARDRRRPGSGDLIEVPAPVRPAEGERRWTPGTLRVGQLLVGAIAVALHDAGIALEQGDSMRGAATGSVGGDHRWWARCRPSPTAPCAIVPGDRPKIATLRPPATGIEHRRPGLVDEDPRRTQHEFAHPSPDRHQLGRGIAD